MHMRDGDASESRSGGELASVDNKFSTGSEILCGVIHSGNPRWVGNRCQTRNPIRPGKGRILTLPPLGREPEFIPMMILASLLKSGEVSKARLGPELAAPLKASLLTTTG